MFSGRETPYCKEPSRVSTARQTKEARVIFHPWSFTFPSRNNGSFVWSQNYPNSPRPLCGVESILQYTQELPLSITFSNDDISFHSPLINQTIDTQVFSRSSVDPCQCQGSQPSHQRINHCNILLLCHFLFLHTCTPLSISSISLLQPMWPLQPQPLHPQTFCYSYFWLSKVLCDMMVIMHSLNSDPDFSLSPGFFGYILYCPINLCFYHLTGPFVLSICPRIYYWMTSYVAELWNFGRNQHIDSSCPSVDLFCSDTTLHLLLY